jgi:putative hemolysin
MSAAGLLILAIFFCLLGNGFFSGSEIAILSVRKSRIEALIAEGSRGARRVKYLQEHMERFLATAQIGVTLMGTLAGVAGGYLASRYLQPLLESGSIARYLPAALEATFLVGLGIVYVELILGELVPKALALRFPDTVALLVSWPFGIRNYREYAFISPEEIKHLVQEGREQGVIGETEVDLIHSVFEFSTTPVKKVMVPRPKVFALDAATPPDDVGRLIVESGFSRIPVFDGTIDNALGLVYVKDVIRLLERRQPVVLRKILHPVHFVPETKRVGDLLKELQRRRSHMALVIDEHGSMTGLVTLEDLIEEIVGEIQDEYDWEERAIEKLKDGSMVVEGTVSAKELREGHNVPIPESEEFQTVAGFMLDQLGSVPKGGEVVPVGDWRLTVVDVERNRISKVKIESRVKFEKAAVAAKS